MQRFGVATYETTSLCLSKWEFGGILFVVWWRHVYWSCSPKRQRKKHENLRILVVLPMCGLDSYGFIATWRSSCVQEGRAQVEFCVISNWVYKWSTVYVYTMESIWNPNSKTQEPDWPQHDRPAVCYRPAVFFRHICLVALSFPLRKNSARVSQALWVCFC
jgi:hypothetical protein